MLSHLRVLDLTDGASGIAGRMLADLGAEVVLIEPLGGVASRFRSPFAGDAPDSERSLEFWANHRGKRSVVLDLDAQDGRDRLRELVGSADVWIDDAEVGHFSSLGLGHADLEEVRPQLIHVSITPFGEIGPKSNWASTDLTVTAASHAMWMTGDSDRAPLTCSVPQAFFHAGTEAAAAIMVALAERESSGLGQHIDVSAQTAMMASSQSTVLAAGWNDRPLGRSGGGVKVGSYRLRFIYECVDGFVNLTLLFGEPIGHATARFFAWMDEEGFATDAIRNEDWVAYGAKLVGGKLDNDAHEAVMHAIERFTRTKTKAELFAAAFERRLLIVPLSDCRDLRESRQLAAREFWKTVKHAEPGGEVVYPGAFARLSATPLEIERPPPRLGQHTAEILEVAASPAREAQPTRSSAAATGAGERALPLAGLKVLDFTWVYAGPAVTRQLAEFGATVIKVESSTAHDALRANGPFKDAQPGSERSGNFASVNLGKLSLGLNMKSDGAREVALRLVDWADVVVENFSPRAMKGFGLDYPTLRDRKPDIVMLSSSLSGGSGPETSLAGYGTMGSALAGFGFVTGWPDRHPAAPFMAYTDYVAPRFAVTSILAALDHRRRTGIGQHIDLSQAECTIHFLGAATLDYSVNGRIASAQGNASPHHAPSGVYPVVGEDRWIAIAAVDEVQWSALAKLASQSGGDDWRLDARFGSNADRMRNREALDQAITRWTKAQEVDALEASLQAVGVPAHRVVNSLDAFEDPQLAARNHFIEIDHPVVGPMPYENTRARFSATPAQPRPCPTLGQDNAYVLGDVLGYSEDEITDLVIAGAIE
jgi:crotonobetainyl-CoA:carnitine CoA-transferase CaiB-like acyl-CoA transferase